jgi:hypothetical protein
MCVVLVHRYMKVNAMLLYLVAVAHRALEAENKDHPVRKNYFALNS